jgi:3-dehydrosphinganine reductase
MKEEALVRAGDHRQRRPDRDRRWGAGPRRGHPDAPVGLLVDRLGFKRASVLADLESAAAVAAVPLLYLAGILQFWQLVLLAARGDLVSLVARNQAQLEEAATSIPGQVSWAVADVTDRVGLERAVADLVQRSGPCDILVAAAGAARPGYLLQLDDQVFRGQMELNYFGVLNAVRTVTPSMVQRRTGSIVAVASTAALIGVYGYAAYAPSKFAVRGLMEMVRSELAPYGVHVGCVFPRHGHAGFAAENRTKPEEDARISAGIRPRRPDEVARAVLRGIDQRRFLITADPQTAALARGAGLLAPVLRRLTDRTVTKVQQERTRPH